MELRGISVAVTGIETFAVAEESGIFVVAEGTETSVIAENSEISVVSGETEIFVSVTEIGTATALTTDVSVKIESAEDRFFK